MPPRRPAPTDGPAFLATGEPRPQSRRPPQRQARTSDPRMAVALRAGKSPRERKIARCGSYRRRDVADAWHLARSETSLPISGKTSVVRATDLLEDMIHRDCLHAEVVRAGRQAIVVCIHAG